MSVVEAASLLEALTFAADFWLTLLSNGIKRMYMKDIHEWCRLHSIEYQTVFVYRKEYSLVANIWNAYSYLRWRVENVWGQR